MSLVIAPGGGELVSQTHVSQTHDRIREPESLTRKGWQ